MTHKTITLSRELAERAMDAIEQVGYQDKFIDYTFVRAVKQEMHAALADPVPPAGSAHPVPVDETGYGMVMPPAGVDVEGFVEFAQTWLYHRYGPVIPIESLSEIDLESEDMKPLYATYQAHVTRLQAEVERLSTGLDYWRGKAIAVANTITVANQSAPADKGQGEPVAWMYRREGGEILGQLVAMESDSLKAMREGVKGPLHQILWPREDCIDWKPLYAEQPAPVAVMLAEAREWLGDGKNADGLAREHWTPEYAALIDRIDATLSK